MPKTQSREEILRSGINSRRLYRRPSPGTPALWHEIPTQVPALHSRRRAPRQIPNYWICTTRPDGRPHSIPVWGFWLDGGLYFGPAAPPARLATSRIIQRSPFI